MFIPFASLITALSFTGGSIMYSDDYSYSYPRYLYYDFVLETSEPPQDTLFLNFSYNGNTIDKAFSINSDYEYGSNYVTLTFQREKDFYVNYSCCLYYSYSSSNVESVYFDLMSNTTGVLGEIQIPFTSDRDITFNLCFFYASEEVYTFVTDNSDIQSVYNNGYQQGQQNPTQEVYDTIYSEGATSGYQTGYTQGYNDAFNTDTTALTIFSGILDIGLLPVNVFLAMLNFDIFGINVGGFITGILTIAVTIILLKAVLGSGVGGGKSD